MTRITWDETQDRFYETGVTRGVFYGYNPVSNKYDDYEVWNGLSKITESPDGGDESAIYSDNQKYLSLTSAEVLKGTIEAYTYPKKFESYDGTVGFPGVSIGQQSRKKFGMAYTTLIGDADTEASIDNNYLIHVIYGVKVSPSEREYGTINDNPDAITFSWKFTTTPESSIGENLKPTASLVFDTRHMSKDAIKKIEDVLYGSSDAGTEPILPSPVDLISIVNLSLQPNLLTVPLGYVNDSNNVTATGAFAGSVQIDSAMYDDFNKHIRDYDGKRMVFSCDLDLTFKDVNIPSSISSLLVYCDQYCTTGIPNQNVVEIVPGTYPNTNWVTLYTNNVKTGSTHTIHLSTEFTMNSNIVKLGATIIGVRIMPDWASGTKLVFDYHAYNPELKASAL